MTTNQILLKTAKRLLLCFAIYATLSVFLVYDEGLRVERYQRMVKISPSDIRAVGILIQPGSSTIIHQHQFERLLDLVAQRESNAFWRRGDKIFGGWFWSREFTIGRLSEESLSQTGTLSANEIAQRHEYFLRKIESRPLIWILFGRVVKS